VTVRRGAVARKTEPLRRELTDTARRMSALGLTPGRSGNVSVRQGDGLLVTPSGMAYDDLRPADMVALDAGGRAGPGQRIPSSEWRLHAAVLAARPDVGAVVHTHARFCTTISTLRRPIPAVHYMVVAAGGDQIPCATYATYGSPELAAATVAALGAGGACLLANHGMVAVGPDLPRALALAAEVETLAAVYWHALQLGSLGPPVVLDPAELARVRARFADYGQGLLSAGASRPRRRRRRRT
jgi:L-fuculose-phosphate aldolase